MIYFILMLGTLFFVLLLLPTLGAARVTAEDTRRLELTEERERLLTSLRELEESGTEQALLTREKVRLTQVLQELDTLPPAPLGGVPRPALPPALLTWLAVAALTVAGSMTVFPKWREAGLPADEATQLRSANQLPDLQRRAEKTGAAADALAWGDAAWSAQKYDLAAKAYTQVLMQDRSNVKAMRRVGFYLLKTPKMATQGFGFIARAAEMAPNDPESLLFYGYALGLAGQYSQGLEVLKKYQTLAPDSHDADDLLVDFQAKTGAAVDGKLVYAQNCAACHGPKLEGGKGPKLLGSAALQNAQALRGIILNGATGMPAFPQLQGQQLEALVGFLQGQTK